MNGIDTTIGAPVTAAAETTPKTSRKAALPTINRRKVLQGKHLKTGAPRLEVIGLTKNLKRGAFTLADIFMANGETISLLTIKKRKNELVAAKKLIKMARDFKQHVGHGRPPEYFNFDLTKGEAKKIRTRKPKVAGEAPMVAAEAPVVDIAAAHEFIANVELPPAPAEQAPVEQPAEVAAV